MKVAVMARWVKNVPMRASSSEVPNERIVYVNGSEFQKWVKCAFERQ